MSRASISEIMARYKRVDAQLRPVLADMQATIIEASEGDAVAAYMACELAISVAAGTAVAFREHFDKETGNTNELSARVLERVAAGLRGKREAL